MMLNDERKENPFPEPKSREEKNVVFDCNDLNIWCRAVSPQKGGEEESTVGP